MKLPVLPSAALFRRILRDRGGVALVELCLVAPLLIVIVCGITDVSLGFARRIVLQQAAARAVEMSSAAGLSGTTAANAKSEAAAAAGVPDTQVTVDTWLECGATRQANLYDTCATGTPARYISVAITDTYSSTFASFLNAFKAGNWATVNLKGFAEVRLQ